MRCLVYSSKEYDRRFLSEAAAGRHELDFLESSLSTKTATLAKGFDAVCCFVNDSVQREELRVLWEQGVKFIALRCAGFNNLDLAYAKQLGFTVARVPAYSPHAVAEHTLGLILSLNRKIHRAYSRVRDNNFALEGLLGFDLFGKTAGVIGTGAIGQCVVRILHGFGCKVLCYDPSPLETMQEIAEYRSLEEVLAISDIVSLHCPLTSATHHLIGSESLQRMKRGVMLINTSRGGLIDTRAVIHSLKSGQLGSLALDVYEEESDLFFQDLSRVVVQDDVFSRLLTFPNVLITAHQAFFTKEALTEIAKITMENLDDFGTGRKNHRTLS